LKFYYGIYYLKNRIYKKIWKNKNYQTFGINHPLRYCVLLITIYQ
jgi:hypothetical protein